MSDPKLDMLSALANAGTSIVTENYVGAIDPVKRLLAMLVAYELPAIDAPALDPNDRAEVDEEVDAAITKP